MKPSRLFLTAFVVLLMQLIATAAPYKPIIDSLPPGTRIELNINLPGEATPTRIRYTVPPALSVIVLPVATQPAVVTPANRLAIVPSYDPRTQRLKVLVTGAISVPRFTIPGVIGNAEQPAEGFLIGANARNTTVTIQVTAGSQTISQSYFVNDTLPVETPAVDTPVKVVADRPATSPIVVPVGNAVSFLRMAEGPVNTALAGTDALGNLFTTSTAPNLPHVPLTTVPNQGAADYTFTPQSARWQMDLGRFPAFDLGGKRIMGIGYPVYSNPSKNLLSSRGNINLDRTVTNVPGQDGRNSHFFWADACWSNAAAISLNTGLPLQVRREAALFAGKGAFDAIQSPVPVEFAGEVRYGYHPYPTLAETGFQVGKGAYGEWSQQESIGNHVPELNLVDLETPDTWPGRDIVADHDQFIAQFQKGLQIAWQQDGNPNKKPYQPKFIGYGLYQFDIGFSQTSERVPAPGGGTVPAYYLANIPVYSNPDLLKTFAGGGLGVDSYWRTSVGEDTDYFVYNPDGTVKIGADGQPVYNPLDSRYTAYGVTVEVSAQQYQHNLHELYGAMGKIEACLWHLNGNQRPARRFSRAPGMETISLIAWDRHTTEQGGGYIVGVPDFPINRNYYPIADWTTEGMTLMKMMLIQMHVRWSMNKPLHLPGANYTPNPGDDEDRGTDGVYEWFAKADHRISLLPELFNADGQLVLFSHPYVDQMRADGNRTTDKPLTVGLLYNEAGKACFGITALFPGQRKIDNRGVEVWFTKGGKTSPVQTFQLAGRHATTVRFILPNGFEEIADTDCWIRYTDLTGQVRTLNGRPN